MAQVGERKLFDTGVGFQCLLLFLCTALSGSMSCRLILEKLREKPAFVICNLPRKCSANSIAQRVHGILLLCPLSERIRNAKRRLRAHK